MVEEKAYSTYVGEYNQRQGHLGESRVVMTRLSWYHVGRGERRRRGKRGKHIYQPGCPKVQKNLIFIFYKSKVFTFHICTYGWDHNGVCPSVPSVSNKHLIPLRGSRSTHKFIVKHLLFSEDAWESHRYSLFFKVQDYLPEDYVQGEVKINSKTLQRMYIISYNQKLVNV